jgi:uncharacterized protein (DUF433 family)
MEKEKTVTELSHRIVLIQKSAAASPVWPAQGIPVWVILSTCFLVRISKPSLRNFPNLSRKDILACLEYASYLATERCDSMKWSSSSMRIQPDFSFCASASRL